jgi:hypothetical protein
MAKRPARRSAGWKGMEMPVRRFGLVSQDPSDTATRQLTTLPWADATTEAVARYRAEQPTAEELGRVDAYQTTPVEMLEHPHLKVRAIENELANMFRNFLVSLEETLDEEGARKVAYAAGLAHGKRRLGTFLSGQGLPGGVESMAMWQDTAHASAGALHTTALFARYDDEVIEVTRTEDSFGSAGQQSPATMAYFDGFIDGYQSVDPQLSHVQELWRERPDGETEFVARFWYRPKS